MARPTRKSPPTKGRSKAARPSAKPAKPARTAAAKRPAKPAKKAPAKTVRTKAPAPKSKPVKKAPAKPPAKPAGRPAPKAVKAAPKAAAAKPAPAPKPVVAKAAPVAKPVPAPAAKLAPPPKPEPPKKPRKPELTPKEIAAIRASLDEQRNVFMREFTDLEESAFNISQSEMSGEVSFDEEYADAGSFTFEREKEMSIGNNIRDLLDKVNHAINAIDRGTYGICENCGNPIAKARLLALPYSTLCLNCKQIDERTR